MKEDDVELLRTLLERIIECDNPDDQGISQNDESVTALRELLRLTFQLAT